LVVASSEAVDGSVDDGEIEVSVLSIAILAWDQTESRVGRTVEQPLLLLLYGDVPYRLGVRPPSAASGPDRVGGEPELPLLSRPQRPEQRVVWACCPCFGGRPTDLLHEVSEVGLVGACDEQYDSVSILDVQSPQDPSFFGGAGVGVSGHHSGVERLR
jgi:hypothetical protein